MEGVSGGGLDLIRVESDTSFLSLLYGQAEYMVRLGTLGTGKVNQMGWGRGRVSQRCPVERLGHQGSLRGKGLVFCEFGHGALGQDSWRK